MLAKSILALVAVATVAVAQDPTIVTSSASSVAATTTLSQAMPPVATSAFNPAPVNATRRLEWCRAQLNTCPQICGGAASQNFCDEDNLTYNCVCPNGTAPDVTSFANTLPFFICQETFGQCMDSHPDDLTGQTQCQENQQCGTRNATAEAISRTQATAESTATSTTGGGSSESASATSSETAASSSSGSAAVANISQLSTGAFALLLAAAFKLFV